jgi:hypothetical protein
MEQLGDSVSVYLDGGPGAGDVPSTIVDLTGSVPRLLRQGVIPVERLRDVIPLAIVDPEDPEVVEDAPAADDGVPSAADDAAPSDADEAVPPGAADAVPAGAADAVPRDGIPGDATPGEAAHGEQRAAEQGNHTDRDAAG